MIDFVPEQGTLVDIFPDEGSEEEKAEKADEEEKTAEKATKDEMHIDDPKHGPGNTSLYLAVLFLLKNYNGPLRNLPGVEKDEKELKEVLKKYQQIIINSSKNILNELKEIIEEYKQKKFERIHFHFSGKIQLHIQNRTQKPFYQVMAKMVSEF